jgi:large subunit ribosomal protein L29
MKSADYIKQLRAKSAEQLNEELAALQKEQFNLRLAAATSQQNKTHLTGDVRKRIARLKTVLQQGQKGQKGKSS